MTPSATPREGLPAIPALNPRLLLAWRFWGGAVGFEASRPSANHPPHLQPNQQHHMRMTSEASRESVLHCNGKSNCHRTINVHVWPPSDCYVISRTTLDLKFYHHSIMNKNGPHRVQVGHPNPSIRLSGKTQGSHLKSFGLSHCLHL